MKILKFYIAVFLLFSCGYNKSKETMATEAFVTETSEKNDDEKKKLVSRTYLCKINGEDWSYTKASGIVSTDRKTGKRLAIIGFTNKLDKGSESIQLYYDLEKNGLDIIVVDIKRSGKSGSRISATYRLNQDNITDNPNTYMSGTIDLSNPNTASGTLEAVIENAYEKQQLKNENDHFIKITDCSFSGIGYSDTSKILESMNINN